MHAQEVPQEVVTPQERARHQFRIFVVLTPAGTLKRKKSKISTVPQEAKQITTSLKKAQEVAYKCSLGRHGDTSVVLNFTSSR